MSVGWINIFILVVFSEMGDRSQITAVALSAIYPVLLVIVGGVLGHLLAMLLAVVAGQMIGQKVKESVLTILGGLLFLFFSVWELVVELLLSEKVNEVV